MTSQTHAPATTNGVDTETLAATIGLIDTQPDLGACRFRARNRWIDGAFNRVEIQGFYGTGAEDTSRKAPFVQDNDEPPILCGNNIGPNPVEHLLTGLSGCLTTTLVYNAALMGVELRAVESEIEGELDLQGLFNLDPAVRPGYRNIRVTFRIDSDAPRAKLEELVGISSRFSPACDSIRNPVNVDVRLAE
jgi:uncharacterized OsmC-like protein